VNRIRDEGIQLLGQHAPGSDGEVNARVAGTGARAEQAGLDHLHQVAGGAQFAHQFDQGRDDAVDLRYPGVGDDGNLHGASASVW
jgi:hypothetical protein